GRPRILRERLVDLFQLEPHRHRVDLLATDDLVGEQKNSILRDLDEAGGHRDAILVAPLLVLHDAGSQRREKWKVTGQHAEFAPTARRSYVVDLFVDREPLRGDDLERDLTVGHLKARPRLVR